MRKIERIIISFKPIAFIIQKSKRIKLPGFNGLPLYDVIVFFITQINKVGLNERAAAISFNFIMAIPAACIFIFTLVPYIPAAKGFNHELLRLTADITPNRNTYIFVRDFLNDFFNTPRTGLLSFGFLLVIFYASNAMMGIIRAFDKSVQMQKKFPFRQRLRAIRLTTILLLLIIASVLMLVGHHQLAKLIKTFFHIKTKLIWWNNVRWFVIIALVFYSIALIYKYAPSLHKRWKLISPGTILATFLTLATTIIFSFWVNNFAAYNKIYGSIGTVLIIMLLIYINSLILLIGFELNVSIMKLKQHAEEREEKEQGD
ncbi:MAG: YihY/virulence factor BrkB family protein [Chitinophagaceae bacterium]|nr:YihY/virulence factor BrkB family protein [Chitinophagaceae bacterium]MCW5905250.1 YihY/virulence factor BrkB family protein [Chitinophagaceae bacterium]